MVRAAATESASETGRPQLQRWLETAVPGLVRPVGRASSGEIAMNVGSGGSWLMSLHHHVPRAGPAERAEVEKPENRKDREGSGGQHSETKPLTAPSHESD